MKNQVKNPVLILLFLLFILPLAVNAADKSKKKSKKESTSFIQQFSNYLPYNSENKEILQNSFVILEIEIDGNGMLHVSQANSSKSEAAKYVIGKINGIKLKEANPHERFILKYYFK